MHPNTDDKDLRDLFAAMRHEEAHRAPAFDPFWEQAVARADRHRRRVVWMRYAAAAVLLVGVVLSALLFVQPRAAMSITQWTSPTAGLMRAPISTVARLPTSVLLAPPAPRLETYTPETQVLLPDDILPDTTN